ncbi:unnamed protein product [Musa acuminata subsp. burmannicoides]
MAKLDELQQLSFFLSFGQGSKYQFDTNFSRFSWKTSYFTSSWQFGVPKTFGKTGRQSVAGILSELQGHIIRTLSTLLRSAAEQRLGPIQCIFHSTFLTWDQLLLLRCVATLSSPQFMQSSDALIKEISHDI